VTGAPLLLTGGQWAAEFCRAVRGARVTLDVLTYTVLHTRVRVADPESDPFNALLAAAHRGVNVRLCRSHAQNIAYSTTRGFPTADALKRSGVTLRVHPSRPTLHAKLLLVDGVAALIGSANISRAAASSNVEFATWLMDPYSVRLAAETFAACWNRAAPEPEFLLPSKAAAHALHKQARPTGRTIRRLRGSLRVTKARMVR
jgi:phosphatidylserine/phosphatidylglycerophosphate/cardiolipin synthase-like enzyme